MRYVSIDIETTGLNPDTCDIIEFGAVIDDCVTPIDELPQFHCYLTPPKSRNFYQGEPTALAMHREIFLHIADLDLRYDFCKPQHLGKKFAKWLLVNEFVPEQGFFSETVRINVAGKNFSSFDWRFLRRLNNFEDYVKIRQRILDPSILYFRPEIDESLPGMEECLRRAGYNKSVDHTAINDALDVIRCLRFSLLSMKE